MTQQRIDWTQAASMQALARLAPQAFERFVQFEQAVFEPGHLSPKIKELIAVAVTHVTQCGPCIGLHARNAQRLGATDGEIAEAVMVAVELRAGAAIGQFATTLQALAADSATTPLPPPPPLAPRGAGTAS